MDRHAVLKLNEMYTDGCVTDLHGI